MRSFVRCVALMCLVLTIWSALVALYNFLSTFSGTHYVTPRTFTAQLGFHF